MSGPKYRDWCSHVRILPQLCSASWSWNWGAGLNRHHMLRWALNSSTGTHPPHEQVWGGTGTVSPYFQPDFSPIDLPSTEGFVRSRPWTNICWVQITLTLKFGIRGHYALCVSQTKNLRHQYLLLTARIVLKTNCLPALRISTQKSHVSNLKNEMNFLCYRTDRWKRLLL